jgi:ABC-type transport system substrate-binding protein
MKRSLSPLAAISCLLALAAGGAHASSRPRYGGTVRISLQHRVSNLDPAAEDDYAATRDRMAVLLFETLTSVDEQGRVHPRLASSWHSDAGKRIWQFRLRLAGFHDGSPLTAADVAASLNRAGGPFRSTVADRQTVNVEGLSAIPHLPEMLAMEKFAIAKRNPDGTLVGTGPYKLSEWQQGERAAFSANEDYWGGRAFPEAMEFQMGGSLREQLLQRQLGPYSAAELGVDQLHSLEQTGQNVDRSRPADLLVIVFLLPDTPLKPGKKPLDPKLREALANSLDRATINNALLQKKGMPASGLLPQWLTGYEFLLPGAQDRDRARRLAGGAVSSNTPITLAYDFSDPVSKLVAERVALDAREVGITVRPYGESHMNTKSARAALNADAVLLRLPLPSLEPSVALATMAGDLGFDDNVAAMLSAARPEDLFELERKTLENFRVIPVARLSLAVWLNSNLHNWQQLPTGEWDMDQIWVEGAK